MSKRLIYAEDAIDALKQLQKSISGDYTELDPLVMAGCGYIGDCIGELECLPSAQPQLEICPIYGGMCGYPSNLCYECPRHEGAKERPQWWTEGLQPFAQPQRWIPVSERLPEEKQDVLLAFKHNMVVGFWEDILDNGEPAWYANSGDGWMTGTESVDSDGIPIAWMPLPEPYKGE